MSYIREISSLTSKGQITLPKPIRQALGVTKGGKLAFELHGDQVIVTRVDSEHRDPAIGAFLSLLESDIRHGRNVGALPPELAGAMLANAGHVVDLDDDVE
jgi:antitoxin PrlF